MQSRNLFSRNRIPQILFVLLIGASLLIIGMSISEIPNISSSEGQTSSFNEGWKMVVNEEEVPLNILPEKIDVPLGTEFTVYNLLPDDITDQMVLALHSSHQSIKVIIEGEQVLVHENYSDTLSKNPVSGFVFVPLKAADAGKKIQISFKSYYIGCSGRIDEMYYGTEHNCIKVALRLLVPRLTLYMFFFMIGILLILCFILIIEYRNRYIEFIYLGLFAIIFSVMIITDNNWIQFFSINHNITLLLSVVSKLLLPFPYLFFTSKLSNSVRTKNILTFLSVLYALIGISVLMAHYYEVMDISYATFILPFIMTVFLLISHICMIIEICIERTYGLITNYLAGTVLITTIVIEVFSFFFYKGSYLNKGIFLGVGIFCYLMIMTAVTINHIIHNLNEYQVTKEELLQSKMSLMLSQIQPHFIYNSLNAIQALIKIKPEKASEMTYNFSKYLRGHIDSLSSENMIPFSKELENIKAYVNIEIIRFPKIDVIYEIEFEDFMVPVLTIQPLVENAIRHGVSKLEQGGTVTIRTSKNEDIGILEISDTGMGFDPSITDDENKSVGLKNISFRLRTLAKAKIEINSEPMKGTTVKVYFPI